MKLHIPVIAILIAGCSAKQSPQIKTNCMQLPASKQLLITNISNTNIIIDRFQMHNPGVSAGWSSMLTPHHKSLLATARKSFCITCTTLNPTRKNNCAGLLKYNSIGSSHSEYWVWENHK